LGQKKTYIIIIQGVGDWIEKTVLVGHTQEPLLNRIVILAESDEFMADLERNFHIHLFNEAKIKSK
jgi:hypothetical protein